MKKPPKLLLLLSLAFLLTGCSALRRKLCPRVPCPKDLSRIYAEDHRNPKKIPSPPDSNLDLVTNPELGGSAPQTPGRAEEQPE